MGNPDEHRRADFRKLRENVAVFRQPGALPEAALDDLLNQARTLDMNEVRASLAAAQESE